jgi:hypothetical protein
MKIICWIAVWKCDGVKIETFDLIHLQKSQVANLMQSQLGGKDRPHVFAKLHNWESAEFASIM